MPDNKLVSVIILTYNNLEYLKEALESVKKQDYENIEIVIADDHSQSFQIEKLKEVVDSVEFERKPIVFSNEVNLGTVKNFNKAITKSSGDFIFPLACDDQFFDEKVVGDIVDFFSNNDVQICTAKRKGKISKKIYPSKEDIEILLCDDYRNKLVERLSVDNFLSGSVLYYRRDYLEKIGGFDEKYRLLEDYPFVYKMAVFGDRIGWFDRITINYGEDGISSKKRWGQNPILVKDFDILFYDDILKNINIIKNERIKRYIYFLANRSGNNVVKKINNYFIYLDIVIIKILYRFSSKEQSIYWRLIKRKKKGS